MKKEKELKHYCDTCRNISEHYADIEAREIKCINYAFHSKIKWCQICGKRTDNGEHEKQDWKHEPKIVGQQILPNKEKGKDGICHYKNCKEETKNIFCKYHK